MVLGIVWVLKEKNLAEFLRDKSIIFDAGCGLGYKAAWLAALAPHALVIAMDFSEAVVEAAALHKGTKNIFDQGDIADTNILDNHIDYVNCDQVIMHTENPEQTFKELSRITNPKLGQIACYWYAKKALPRELIDDHFRLASQQLNHDELLALSEQLTELGRRLTDLNVRFDCPEYLL